MAINGQTIANVTTALANADTTEASFRGATTGIEGLAKQVDDNQILLATLTDRTGAIGAPVSVRLGMLDRIPADEANTTDYTSTTAGVVRLTGSASHTLRSGFVTIFHSGTGTVTITADANTPDGAAFYVASSGTLTMAYAGPTGHTSAGISLGSATKIASGAYDKTANDTYFSETVT